jgi:hypothetical protein
VFPFRVQLLLWSLSPDHLQLFFCLQATSICVSVSRRSWTVCFRLLTTSISINGSRQPLILFAFTFNCDSISWPPPIAFPIRNQRQFCFGYKALQMCPCFHITFSCVSVCWQCWIVLPFLDPFQLYQLV